ncbi:MAG: PhzF family phenazine biosynthesis protein [Asgard group archaeon]|nr:PhzF family phenazine biosynthesis protein [Asgard group archaeon]
MEIRLLFYQVDAFTDTPFFGNPTAIIIEDSLNPFSTELKKFIAREMNLPISVYVSESETANFKFEFFTPKKQVPISGHGTIAAVWLLAELGKISTKESISKVKIDTNIGKFPCELHWNGKKIEKVYMTQKKPKFREIDLTINKLADILGIREDKIESNEKLPFIVADTGSPKILALLSSKEMTDALVPKFDDIERLCLKYKSTGIHLYTFDTYFEGSKCYTRHFEPIRGAPETVISGMANGALGAFLVSKGFAQPGTIIFEQGESLDRISKLEVIVDGDETEVKSVKIGGKAHVVFKFDLDKRIKI